MTRFFNSEPDSLPTVADLDAVAKEEEIKEATVGSEMTEWVDSWDVEPQPPKAPVNDADHPRWVRENVVYLEKLGQHRSWLALKQSHPHEAARQAFARKKAAQE